MTDVPLCSTGIWTNDYRLLPPWYLHLDMPDHHRLAIQVIDRNVEKALYLPRVEIDGDKVVATRCYKHICNKLGGDRCPTLVLLVLASVRVTGDDSGDAPCGGGAAGGDEDEELHHVVVHVEASRLDDEHVFVSYRLGDFDVDLPV